MYSIMLGFRSRVDRTRSKSSALLGYVHVLYSITVRILRNAGKNILLSSIKKRYQCLRNLALKLASTTVCLTFFATVSYD